MSGTLRSTLDVFDEYTDTAIVCWIYLFQCLNSLDLSQFEALRRVHLIPPEGTPEEDPETVNENVFRNLDSTVSEGGENFSTGYW